MEEKQRRIEKKKRKEHIFLVKIFVSRLSARHKNIAKKFLKILFPTLGSMALKALVKKIRLEKALVFTARWQKKVLGFAALSAIVFLGKKIIHLKYLSVDPRFRHRGVGKKILTEVEKSAQKQNGKFLFLMSAPWRKSAHEFYRKRGFHRFLGFFFWKKTDQKP